jgi:hypothetical protein
MRSANSAPPERSEPKSDLSVTASAERVTTLCREKSG